MTDDPELAEVLAFDPRRAIEEAQAEASKRSPEERGQRHQEQLHARRQAACYLHPGGPEWLIDRLVEHGLNVPPEERLGHSLATSARGEARHPLLFKAADHLLEHDVDPFVCLALLLRWGFWGCDPPLVETDVVRVVNGIAAQIAIRRTGAVT